MPKIVRTPTRATGGVTAAERAQMAELSALWIRRAMRTEPIEPEKIIPAIHALYAAAGLKQPRVVIVPSPLVMAFAYGASAAIWHARGNATDAATVAATAAATRAATDAATRAATDAATAAATHAATVAATEKGAAAACFALAGKLGLECAKRWWRPYQGGNMWAAWSCYLAAFRDILGLRLQEHGAYQAWEDASIHGGFRVLHPEFCIVCDFPEVIRVDAENRPHCEDGPSHRWRDGWELYHWRGVKIPAEWITDRASLTPQVALTWPNIEQRRCAMEIIGWANMLRALSARVVDDSADPQTGTLVEVHLPAEGRDTIRARFLHVECGTRREFALGVPPDTETAEAAQAWLFGEAEYLKPEIRT